MCVCVCVCLPSVSREQFRCREVREEFSEVVRLWRNERVVATETVRLYRRRGLSDKNIEICGDKIQLGNMLKNCLSTAKRVGVRNVFLRRSKIMQVRNVNMKVQVLQIGRECRQELSDGQKLFWRLRVEFH